MTGRSADENYLDRMHRSSTNIDYTGHVHTAHSAECCVLECALLGVVRVILLIFGQMRGAGSGQCC